MSIFWMDCELNSLTLGMMVLDELKEDTQSFSSISESLIAVIDEEVEYPVVFQTSWIICEFRKPYHLVVVIECIWYPDKSAWANVSLCKGNRHDRNVVCNESVVV